MAKTTKKSDRAAEVAALLAVAKPLYAQLTDPQDKVAFVLAMTGRGGPKPSSGAGLQIQDFGIDLPTFNGMAQDRYNEATNTFGGRSRGDGAVPVARFQTMLTQAGVTGKHHK